MSTQTTRQAERAEMIDLAREIAQRELAPRALAIDAGDREALRSSWGALCEVGFDRALLAEDLGGVGIGVADLLAVIEELAAGEAGIALSALLCNAALAALPPERAAAAGVQERWALVPVLADADAAAPGDPSASPRVRTLGLGAWEAAGIVLVFAGQRSTLALCIDDDRLEIAPYGDQLGLRGAPAGTISLLQAHDGEMAPVDGRRAQGEDGQALLSLLREGIAAIATGIARRAAELACDYALARRQGGVAIIEHDAVSDMLAGMAARQRLHTAGARAMNAPAAADAPADGAIVLDAADAIAAKALATDAAAASTIDAVQVFGGTGYMRESQVEKLMRDARCCQLFPESNWVALDELMRLRAGRGDRGR